MGTNDSGRAIVLGRRHVVRLASAGLGFGLLPSTAWGQGSRLFALGVASGDPEDRAVTLWTRLAPDPLIPGGGMSPATKSVCYEVALDPAMQSVVRRGRVLALAEHGHSIRVRVRGLEPDRWYWYRFIADGEDSPVGRTRTFPHRHCAVDRLRFALASCQDFQNGFYSAYDNLVTEDLDFVLHVGDYIYEDGPREGAPRQVNGPEIVSLDDYRIRYALYRLDPSLQAAHAAFPWIVTWDDHEVDNNYAGSTPEDAQDPAAFLDRRASAYRAYAENMPISPSIVSSGSSMTIHRRFDFGALAAFHVLDTRQFRSDQPCGDGIAPLCPDAIAETQTMTGAAQEQWLLENLRASKTLWNVLAQQVMFMRWDLRALAGGFPVFNMDAWDGYQAARARIIEGLVSSNASNPIILTGDIHSAWAANIHENDSDPESAIVAAEFVGTSITSDFPVEFLPLVAATLGDNPHIQFFDGANRGYVTFDVDRERWVGNFRAVQSILEPVSPIRTLASFTVEEGVSGLVRSP